MAKKGRTLTKYLKCIIRKTLLELLNGNEIDRIIQTLIEMAVLEGEIKTMNKLK